MAAYHPDIIHKWSSTALQREKKHPQTVGVILVQYKASSPVLKGEPTPFWYSFEWGLIVGRISMRFKVLPPVPKPNGIYFSVIHCQQPNRVQT
jgi:hypothetical protein